ncbi:MAG: UDP-N-acetylmuramoyl-tripeptide--D-alanyl-D-alanine ligase [Nitrospirota bacterium]
MAGLKGCIAEPASARAEDRRSVWDMLLFTVEEVLEVTGGRLLSGEPRGIKRVCTDSRDVRRGDLFVALAGERFDGHDFVATAIGRGAVGAIVQKPVPLPGAERPAGPGRRAEAAAPFLVKVPDTLAAFQQLAAHHRSRFRIPLVAVTGSNGKTTTKDMVAEVLAEWGTVLKTEGNLNNRVGVPQTLFRLTSKHETAVIEMGVDRKGQTARLCEIAHPTIGIITNIGPDHLEFFGSLAASAQAKGELLDLLPPDGAVVLNADDAYFDYLASRARCRVLSFGLSPQAEVRATDIVQDPRRGLSCKLVLPGRTRGTPVTLAVHGLHNLSNALAAAAVGFLLDMSGVAIARGLARFRPASMRSQIRNWRGIRIVNDCYNANPASMKAAVALLTELGAGGRTIAVLGDMLELGPDSPALHREVGASVAERGVSHLVACGTLGRGIAEGARAAGMDEGRIREAADAEAAGGIVKELARPGDVVLVKASRGMKMERAIETLTEKES